MSPTDIEDCVRRASEISASSYSAILSGINRFTTKEIEPVAFIFEVVPAKSLSTKLLDWCLSSVEANMKKLYLNSAIGWDRHEKAREFSHENSRFLFAFRDRKERDPEMADVAQEVQRHSNALACGTEPVAFTMFQFSTEENSQEDLPVLYCYELQLAEQVRGIGLGSHMMRMLEVLARHCGMVKVMLTVFKENARAMRFYISKLGFMIDEISPSACLPNGEAEEYDYEILSKDV